MADLTVMMLSQSSHLDWDWILAFPTLLDEVPPTSQTVPYFNSANGAPAAGIFDAAGALLQSSSAYLYSVCEVGFLRGYAEANPSGFQALRDAGTRLHIVGGGITSPDNLLPHGEAFIRNYLIGTLWVQSALGLSVTNAWLPDDFGHDSQLPVLLREMGFQGVAFARVPGSLSYRLSPVDGSPSVAAQLRENGADFIWQANDGSTVIAHWLQSDASGSGGYCEGDSLRNGDLLADVASFLEIGSGSSLYGTMFVPVGCDFAKPLDLPSIAAKYNNLSGKQITAQVGTFDDYVAILQSAALPTQPFNPVPYHNGCYAMRPAIKQLHHQATRALLAAEAWNLAASAAGTGAPAAARVAALDACWNELAPSTHHDYITGTAVNSVYYGEQLPLLRAAAAGAAALRDAAAAEVAAQVAVSPSGDETAVVVFNPLGCAVTRHVEVLASVALSVYGGNGTCVRAGQDSVYAQPLPDGGILFPVSLPSLGYATVYVSDGGSVQPPSSPVKVDFTSATQPVTISSGLLRFTLDPGSAWGISGIYDAAAPQANLLTGTGNDVVLYQDTSGSNYNFGNEQAAPAGMSRLAATLAAAGIEVVEAGPLRARVVTRATWTEPDSGQVLTLTREYVLLHDEPMIRMRTTGRAPLMTGGGYDVCVQFPLGSAISGYAYGTPYHWTAYGTSYLQAPQTLVRYWKWGPVFTATHDFVVPVDEKGQALCAIYHDSVPAWGTTSADDASPSTLVGCLLRNTTGTNFNYAGVATPPSGTDPDEHTLDYAFRLPSGLGSPATGQPLAEARAYNTPVQAVPVVAGGSLLPEALSLASVSAAQQGVAPMVGAAKLGSSDPSAAVFRVYQPSNATTEVTLSVEGLATLMGNPALNASAGNALETSGYDYNPISTSVTYSQQGALATTFIIRQPSPEPEPAPPAPR